MSNKGRFISNDLVCGSKCGLNDSKVMMKFPFKKARLRKQKNGNKERYFIEFFAWQPYADNLEYGRLVRKRNSYNLNKLKGPELHIQANSIIFTINKDLQEGLILPPDNSDQLSDGLLDNMTVGNALTYAIKIKREVSGLKTSTLNHYKAIDNIFLKWLADKKLADVPISKFTEANLYAFFDYLLKGRKVKNKTYNNYKGTLGALFNVIMRRSPKALKKNPATAIKKLKVLPNKNSPYSDEQMKIAINFFEKSEDRNYMVLFVQMMYYTLARPNELRALRISDIDLSNNRIFIKDSKTVEGYCGIPAPLRTIIINSQIMDNPGEYYVFGNTKKPGLVPYQKDTFYERNKYMLEKTGLDKLREQFTLYSYKHTGAISLYRATKDIKLVQRQMRHVSLEQTNIYLRDLGMFNEFEGLDNWQGAI